jgi:hypothetical protein
VMAPQDPDGLDPAAEANLRPVPLIRRRSRTSASSPGAGHNAEGFLSK